MDVGQKVKLIEFTFWNVEFFNGVDRIFSIEWDEKKGSYTLVDKPENRANLVNHELVWKWVKSRNNDTSAMIICAYTDYDIELIVCELPSSYDCRPYMGSGSELEDYNIFWSKVFGKWTPYKEDNFNWLEFFSNILSIQAYAGVVRSSDWKITTYPVDVKLIISAKDPTHFTCYYGVEFLDKGFIYAKAMLSYETVRNFLSVGMSKICPNIEHDESILDISVGAITEYKPEVTELSYNVGFSLYNIFFDKELRSAYKDYPSKEIGWLDKNSVISTFYHCYSGSGRWTTETGNDKNELGDYILYDTTRDMEHKNNKFAELIGSITDAMGAQMDYSDFKIIFIDNVEIQDLWSVRASATKLLETNEHFS